MGELHRLEGGVWPPGRGEGFVRRLLPEGYAAVFSVTTRTSHHGWVWLGPPGEMQEKRSSAPGSGCTSRPNQMDDFTDGHESTDQRFDVSSADVPSLAWPVLPSLLPAPLYSPKAWDPNRKDGYFENWDFTVERMLPGNFIGQIAYDGSEGHRLFRQLTGQSSSIH